MVFYHFLFLNTLEEFISENYDRWRPRWELAMIFKAGDRVRCAFFGEEIFTLQHNGNHLPNFSRDGTCYDFLEDGRWAKSHTASCLTLVERPKEKVSRKLYVATTTIYVNPTLQIAEGTVCAFEKTPNSYWEEFDLGGHVP